MAYDESHPKYLGEKADLTEITIPDAIYGFNTALLARDFEIGRRLAMSAATKNDGNIMKNGQERRGRDSGAPSRSSASS